MTIKPLAHLDGARSKDPGAITENFKQPLILGTSPPGGGFIPYGDAVATTIHEFSPGLTVIPKFTRGSLENIPLLEDGSIQLGLVGGEAAFEALTGIGRTPASLRVISAMYSSAGMFVVPGRSQATTVSDLIGKPVIFGAPGSSLGVQARYILDGMGLDLDRDFEAIFIARDDEARAMLDNDQAAALWGGGLGWPAFIDLAQSPGGARFLVPSSQEIDKIVRKHTFLKRMEVPANTYHGQTVPIISVGSWSVILAHADLDRDLAYMLASALHKGERRMAELVPSGCETTSQNSLLASPTPEYLHPGVVRFFEDIELM
jgi:TRAP transporter TAXI family solute receptor